MKIFSLTRKYLRSFRKSAWILEGIEKNSHCPMRVFYVGENTWDKNYIANIVYCDSFQERFLGRFWAFNPLTLKPKQTGDCDLTVTQIHKRHKINDAQGCFYIPCWVYGKIDIEEAFRLTKSNRHTRNDMKRILKSEFKYEIHNERKKFIEFYNNFYIPYIKKTYADEATTHSLKNILSEIDHAELLMIKDSYKEIAGEVIVYRNNEPKVLCIGVRDGDREYVKAGAINAAYYFRLRHLKTKGYKTIDLGASRGFLSDGVLQYKKKWGLFLTNMHKSGFMIHHITSSPACGAFLMNHPFLNHDQNGFTSVCFVDGNKLSEQKQKKKIFKGLLMPGVKKLQIFQMGKTKRLMDFYAEPPIFC